MGGGFTTLPDYHLICERRQSSEFNAETNHDTLRILSEQVHKPGLNKCTFLVKSLGQWVE